MTEATGSGPWFWGDPHCYADYLTDLLVPLAEELGLTARSKGTILPIATQAALAVSNALQQLKDADVWNLPEAPTDDLRRILLAIAPGRLTAKGTPAWLTHDRIVKNPQNLCIKFNEEGTMRLVRPGA